MLCAVKSLLGIEERELAKLPIGNAIREACITQLPYASDPSHAPLDVCFNRATGEHFPIGKFGLRSLADLRGEVAAMAGCRDPALPCPLNTRSRVDIGELQGTLKSSDRAMVQVASNFNCLENGSADCVPSQGGLVDGACHDCTQGPAAVFGCLPAYLYRCHFYIPGGQRGGTDPNQVNLLQNVAKYFGVPCTGKLMLTGEEETIRDIDAVAGRVCLGLHEDCAILWGRDSKRLFAVQPGRQKGGSRTGTALASPPTAESVSEWPLVDQVFSASINLKWYGKRRLSETAEHLLVRTLVRAAYEGIYLAAILRQRRRLLLTLVGGGVFGNPLPIIIDEIVRAHKMYATHPASSLEEVVICLYSDRESMLVQNLLTAKGKEFQRPSSSSAVASFSIGERVVLEALSRAEDLHGAMGEIVSGLSEAGGYLVHVVSPEAIARKYHEGVLVMPEKMKKCS